MVKELNRWLADSIEDIIENYFVIILLLTLLLVIAGVLLSITRTSRDPYFVLFKNEWECNKTEEHIYYIPTYPDGKNVVMMPQFDRVCVRYERR